MSIQTQSVMVYFDFLCPFAYRTVQWIELLRENQEVDLQVQWKYFSLEQSNQPESSDWKIWEQPEDYADVTGFGPAARGLLSFWAAEAARQQGAALFDRMRMALYHARHRDKVDASQRANVEQLAEQVGLDMAQFRKDLSDRRLLETLRRDHEQAVETGMAFGVPTLVFDDDNSVFVKMMRVPPVDEALPTLQDLLQTFMNPRRRWLAEVKRPNPGPLA